MTTQERGYVVGPNEGRIFPNPVGGQVVLKASDQDTGGAYSLYENIMPAHSPGPRPHIHHLHDEAFYVLEGVLTVRVGMRTLTAPAGSFVLVPRGIVHQPANPGPEPVRFLLIFSPGGMDQFFADAAARHIPLQVPTTDPSAMEALADFSATYHFEFAEFPGAR
ncbi:MAG: cupin domain-containing protein [Chloroflexaceae bacterium]